jgi:hypothetical protein
MKQSASIVTQKRAGVFSLVFVVVIAVLGWMFLSGCSHHPVYVPRHYFVAINASASNSAQLGQCVYLASRLCGMMDATDTLNVFRVDDTSRPIYQGPALNDTEKFQAQLAGGLEALSKETGTHSLGFWKTASKALETNAPTTVIFLTDGFEEGITKQELAELRQTGKQMAAHANLRVVYVLGVHPKMAGLWQSVFQDMGSRFCLKGPLTRASIEQIETAADQH